MKYLLDTHAFIWWNIAPEKLSPDVTAICIDSANVLLLSLVSLWEMQIKIQLGKLYFPVPLPEVISAQQGILMQDITIQHIYQLAVLPDYHRDPFDRLLIAQAQVENIAIISRDPQILNYPVQVIW